MVSNAILVLLDGLLRDGRQILQILQTHFWCSQVQTHVLHQCNGSLDEEGKHNYLTSRFLCLYMFFLCRSFQVTYVVYFQNTRKIQKMPLLCSGNQSSCSLQHTTIITLAFIKRLSFSLTPQWQTHPSIITQAQEFNHHRTLMP